MSIRNQPERSQRRFNEERGESDARKYSDLISAVDEVDRLISARCPHFVSRRAACLLDSLTNYRNDGVITTRLGVSCRAAMLKRDRVGGRNDDDDDEDDNHDDDGARPIGNVWACN